MDIVTGWNRGSPLDFRVNPQIRGGARRPPEHVTPSTRSGMTPSNTMAMRRRRIPAQCAVIIALISGGSSVVGAAQPPVMAWPRMHNGAYSANVSAPLGEITPDPPPEIPAPTVKPLEPPVAAPPPRAQQPVSPPTQQQGPPPQQQGPPPQQQGPAPQAPAPAPPPAPPPQRPPGGHVQLAP